MNRSAHAAILDRILRTKQEEIDYKKEKVKIDNSMPAKPGRDFKTALLKPGLSVIAEMKRKSPSAGILRENYVPEQIAAVYEKNGASALSVLTDTPFFGGCVSDMRKAKAACSLPVLRKDFILDAYQIAESKAAGADAILLIVRILGKERLSELMQTAEALGMQALVETHTASEILTAVEAGAEIIGINNRDLDTLQVDISRCIALVRSIPDHCIAVAESGIRTSEDLMRMENAGFHAALIGEALLRGEKTGILNTSAAEAYS